MSKEYLESLKKIKQEFNCDPEYYGLGGAFEILESALYRLEAIDNSNPSEALEDLIDMIEYFTRLDYVEPIVRNEIHDKFKDIYWHKLPHLDTIKQALLKAQEPKQYLKWEDLEFTRERQFIKVKLNNTEYILKYYVSVLKEEMIEILGADKSFVTGLSHTCINDKQFFNDLRLERVEE